MIIGTIALAVTGIVVAILVALCSSGTIGRNPVVGIRVPALLASDEAWKGGHRAAVLPTVVAAIAACALGALALIVPSLADWGILLSGGPVLLGLIWATIRASNSSAAISASASEHN